MPHTLSSATLTELVAAERALGRLDQATADSGRRSRQRGDLARRSAVAIVRLDGERVDAHDLRLALAAPEHADGPAYRAALTATLLRQMQHGLIAGGSASFSPRVDGDIRIDPRLSVLRRKLMEEALGDSITDDDVEVADDVDPASVAEWTIDWVDEIHRRWSVVHAGRAEPMPAARRETATAVLENVRNALEHQPGLLGAAAAFRMLALCPDSDGTTQGGWWRVVSWHAAPALLRSACALPYAWPPLTVAFARDVTGYRMAIEGDAVAWTDWFLRTIQEMVDRELDRLRALDLVYGRWNDTLERLDLRSTSRLPEVVGWLFEHPAFTIKRATPQWKSRFGLSDRGCHLLTRQLAKAGIVSELTGPGGERVWASELSFLPSGW